VSVGSDKSDGERRLQEREAWQKPQREVRYGTIESFWTKDEPLWINVSC
jgi:hypothetical protein